MKYCFQESNLENKFEILQKSSYNVEGIQNNSDNYITDSTE